MESKIGPIRIDYSQGTVDALDKVIAEQRAWEVRQYGEAGAERVRKLREDAAEADRREVDEYNDR